MHPSPDRAVPLNFECSLSGSALIFPEPGCHLRIFIVAQNNLTFPPDRQFILLGSSARKLKRGGANLLAGRAVQRLLFPFTLAELGEHFNLDDALRFGTLPPLFGLNDAEKQDTLNAYTETYQRAEIQMEGFVRNLAGFYRFMEMAASTSGGLLNFSNTPGVPSAGQDGSILLRNPRRYAHWFPSSALAEKRT